VTHADDVVGTLLSPLRRLPLKPGTLAAFYRDAALPASLLVRRFATPEARALLAGVAAHIMRPLDRPPTGAVGLLLGTLAHTTGWPVVEGGSARIVEAMVEAIEASGGEVVTGTWLRSLAELPRARALLLDVTPRAFVAMAGDQLPVSYRRSLARFRYGSGVCKVDFALSGPVPWEATLCRKAGTVHVGGTYEEVAASEAEVAAGRHPLAPYVLAVQPGVVDASRAPAGRHTLWTYCHVPAGSTLDMSSRIEAQLERFAPGFRDLILAKAVRTAADVERENPNYVGGDIGAGAQTLWQSVVRPTQRWNPYRTPLRGVYLCSSSTPPGPGVHGRCGELAALTAIRHEFPDVSRHDTEQWAREF
jgi:phytoene dehydrogenase-like protein